MIRLANIQSLHRAGRPSVAAPKISTKESV